MLSGMWDDKWISGFGRFTISLASAVCPPSATSMSHCNTLFCCSVIISTWHVIEWNRNEHKKDNILLHFFPDSSIVTGSVQYQSGETAILPCDISVPSRPRQQSSLQQQQQQQQKQRQRLKQQQKDQRDELVLVMWYREDVRSPIYSIGQCSHVLIKCASPISWKSLHQTS